ncbi:MAG: hypothetical protein M1816_005296 [Peltula sp. TS41687]|nr:MAG: hypothetical protein M1816_005296 [Peltula sp. TS41687]
MSSSPERKYSYAHKLRGTTVLVLGGTSGIGFCVAECALEAGASVIISSSNANKLSSALERLRANHPLFASSGRISGHRCDLGQASQLEGNLMTLLQSCATTISADSSSKSKKIDHIAFTAGDTLRLVPVSAASVHDIQAMGTVRFVAPLVLAKVAPAFMAPGPGSSIVLTGGTNSAKPISGWSIPAAWGAGIEGMTRGLAVDLKPIRVNCVVPGAVHTELFGSFPKEELDGVLERFRAETLTGEVGKPESVAEAYVYLMKDRFATGSIKYGEALTR